MFLQRKTYDLPPVDTREVLRYAKAGQEMPPATAAILQEVLEEGASFLSTGRVCFLECPLQVSAPQIVFGELLETTSADLSKNLDGCFQAVLFGATIGIELDRRIAKYGLVSPTKALFFQALGAERIEALCDVFCNDIAASHPEMAPRPRFSPGYGDLPLEFQQSLFRVLDAPRQIGLTLNESLQMSPSKSVTAILGLTRK